MAEFDLGDDFEALLRSRLRGHQVHLDRHRTNVLQKIDWLTPTRSLGAADLDRNGSASHSAFAAENEHCADSKSQTAFPEPITPGRPSISDTSKRLAAKRRNELGVAELPIEESLAAQSQYSKTLKWLSSQAIIAREVPAKPVLTPRALKLPSSSVEETTIRLSQNSRSSQRALATLKAQLENLVDENLEATFKPLITKKAEQLQRRHNHTAHDDLYELAQSKHQFRQQLEAANREKETKELRSRTPKINRLSELIAERLPETTEDRLYRQRRKSFHETAPETPHRIHSTARTNALHQEYASRKEKILSLVAEREALCAEHTFTPKITSRAKSSRRDHQSLPERLQLWEAKKLKKIESLREDEKKTELSECTFTPSTNVDSYEQNHNHSEPMRRDNNKTPISAAHAPIRAAKATPAVQLDNGVLKMALDALNRARNASRRIDTD